MKKITPATPHREAVASAEAELLPTLPVLSLFVLLAMLGISFLYPQGAYPLRGVVVASGFWLALVAGMVGVVQGQGIGPAAGLPLALAWAGWWWFESTRSPVASMGREDLSTAVQAVLVFATTMTAVRSLGSHPSLGRVFATAPVALVVLLSLHGIYQVHGPAALAGTFRHIEQELVASGEGTADEIGQGILHAVRERRAASTLGSSNVLAGVLAMGLPLLMALGLESADRRRRQWVAVGAVLVAVALFETGSRGGVLSAVAGVVVFALLHWRSRLPRLLLPGIAVALALGVFAFLLAQPTVGSRWFGNTTITQRLLYWKSALALWGQAPWLGMGTGAFEALYAGVQLPGANETKYAHSWFFQWGAEGGVIALALFATVLGGVLRGSWRVPDNAALIAALAAGLVDGLVDFSFPFREFALLWWFLLGIVAGRRGVGEGVMQPLSIGVALLAAAPLLLQVQFKPAVAAMYREQSVGLAEDNAGPVAVLAALDSSLRWEPDNSDSLESRGLQRLQVGDAGGWKDLEKAAELNPYSARLQERFALLAAGEGHLDEAILRQHKAISLHPVDASRRLTLIELLIKAGRADEARSELTALDEKIKTRGVLTSAGERDRLASVRALLP